MTAIRAPPAGLAELFSMQGTDRTAAWEALTRRFRKHEERSQEAGKSDFARAARYFEMDVSDSDKLLQLTIHDACSPFASQLCHEAPLGPYSVAC